MKIYLLREKKIAKVPNLLQIDFFCLGNAAFTQKDKDLLWMKKSEILKKNLNIKLFNEKIESQFQNDKH